MSVDGTRKILAAGMELHGNDGFGNQFGGRMPEDVDPQNLVSFFVSEDFDQPFRFSHSLRPTAGGIGKTARAVGNTRSFQARLGLTHPRHLWVRVKDRWNHIVIDVTGQTGNPLSHGQTFFRTLMRQHRPAHHITDGKDVG